MIAIITENGRLRATIDVAIPNAEGGQWSPMRIKALARDIKAHVSANELADLSAKHAPPVNPWPPRKASTMSGPTVLDIPKCETCRELLTWVDCPGDGEKCDGTIKCRLCEGMSGGLICTNCEDLAEDEINA